MTSNEIWSGRGFTTAVYVRGGMKVEPRKSNIKYELNPIPSKSSPNLADDFVVYLTTELFFISKV